jgi:hypothetical protein
VSGLLTFLKVDLEHPESTGKACGVLISRSRVFSGLGKVRMVEAKLRMVGAA